MQYLHPMQRFSSIRMMPSSVLKVALTGQTRTHGGLSHWLHSFGTKKFLALFPSSCLALGYRDSGPFSPQLMDSTKTAPSSPMPYLSTQVLRLSGSSGTWFSSLQACRHLK